MILTDIKQESHAPCKRATLKHGLHTCKPIQLCTHIWQQGLHTVVYETEKYLIYLYPKTFTRIRLSLYSTLFRDCQHSVVYEAEKYLTYFYPETFPRKRLSLDSTLLRRLLVKIVSHFTPKFSEHNMPNYRS